MAAGVVAVRAAHEPVHILAGGDEVMADATRRVGHLANVTLFVKTLASYSRPTTVAQDFETFAPRVLDGANLRHWYG